ncbi:MAG: NAD(P)H-binding protein [Deltaproteobacteria bacterium]|nr:NAD(P)H-binding protein [Deltaproteobacteria bacterium]
MAKEILLTGATGFIGSRLAIALQAAGHEVRCATRSVDESRARHPALTWVELDLEKPETLAAALAGCDAAFYLVHGMGPGHGDDYPAHEAASANDFVAAAEVAKLRRIVYLGGVIPRTGASKHLRSREHTGEILRLGATPTIELRAAMIIGAGSASWNMVRDLSRRLPAMLLPRWLLNYSYPIAVEDVIRALIAALDLEEPSSCVYEIPGPERVSHRSMLVRTAAAMGRKSRMISVPVLTPRLSSYWIALVTRTPLALAKELVEGVRHDLDPLGRSLWDRIELRRTPLDDAIKMAIADEDAGAGASLAMTRRLEAIGHRSDPVVRAPA